MDIFSVQSLTENGSKRKKRRRRCKMEDPVYGLTQSLGEAKGGKPKPNPEGLPCEETLWVSLSPKPEKGVIALAAPWNALPRKPRTSDTTQQVYSDVVRDFLKTKGIEQPKVKIEDILRVDLDGDGEDEVLISATNYFSKDDHVPMASRRQARLTSMGCRWSRRSGNELTSKANFTAKAYVKKRKCCDAPMLKRMRR